MCLLVGIISFLCCSPLFIIFLVIFSPELQPPFFPPYINSRPCDSDFICLSNILIASCFWFYFAFFRFYFFYYIFYLLFILHCRFATFAIAPNSSTCLHLHKKLYIMTKYFMAQNWLLMKHLKRQCKKKLCPSLSLLVFWWVPTSFSPP